MSSDIRNMNLEGLQESKPSNNELDSSNNLNGDEVNKPEITVPKYSRNLFGTLIVEGLGYFNIALRQTKTYKMWTLYKDNILTVPTDEVKNNIVAVVKSAVNGKLTGYGQTNILLRLLDSFSNITARALAVNTAPAASFLNILDYSNENKTEILTIKSYISFHNYQSIIMIYEGFKLRLEASSLNLPLLKNNELIPIINEHTKAVITSSLGIKTLAILKKSKGEELKFLEKKKYKEVDTDEKFTAMMVSYLDTVQQAYKENKTILTGLDTETTGLNVFNLSRENPYLDHIVAIPFSWKKDEAYLIFTDMAYFNNVSENLIYSLFNTLFSRPKDFADREIEIKFGGKEYKFNRNNITLAGYNAIFDRMAFMCHGADVYFDEDGIIGMFDMAPYLVKDRNSLKDWSFAMTGDKTLELGELFGEKHKDKFRYIQDVELALAYGCADSDYTRIVVGNNLSVMYKEMRNSYKHYDIPVMNLLATSAWKGVPIDSEAVREEGKGIEDDLNTIQEFIYSYTYEVYREGVSTKIGELAQILNIEEGTLDTDIQEILNNSNREHMFRFEFKPAALKRLLFGVLNYPIISYSDKGAVKMDKNVLDKLTQVRLDKPSNIMKSDLVSKNNPEHVLIEADKFNSYKYPMAYVLKEYATLNKEYTSYYKPIMNNDLEGRMFYSFSMSFAATRRILSPGQTMKGSLKKLVTPTKDKMIMCFDARQIEFVLMASLAMQLKRAKLKKKYPNTWEEELHKTHIYQTFMEMHKEEADYHIQTAAQMTNTEKHLVKHSVRKKYKTVGFGIPYGLSTYKLCEKLYGKITDELMIETQAIMDDYCEKQEEIIDLLESTRDAAFYPAEIHPKMREWLQLGDSNVGMVTNIVGSRYFYELKNLTKKNTNRIRRQVGNCLVQGGAAELFRRMLLNFYMACVRHGISDKVNIFMVVHDEVDVEIDRDIDVLLLIKIIYENCTLRYKDHIPYFMGIGFGDSWGVAKDDSAELPIIMTQRLIQAYDNGYRLPNDGRQAVYLEQMKYHYLCDRVGECLAEIYPDLHEGYDWTGKAEHVNEMFSNYIVRSYLPTFISSEVAERAKLEKRDVTLEEQLQCWQKVRDDIGFNVKFTDVVYHSEDKSTDENQISNDSIQTINSLEDIDLSIDVNSDEVDLSNDISIDLEDDLSVEIDSLSDRLRNNLLDDGEDEENENLTANSWFDESALFNFNSDNADLDEDNEFIVSSLAKSKDIYSEYDVNESPVSAFDVLVSKTYKRVKIIKSSDNVYVAMLDGSEPIKNFEQLCSKISNMLKPGNQTLMIVGSQVKTMANVNLDDDILDNLDKYLIGSKESEV